ncbi:MAG: hypothetical protein K1563_12135 [Candidatus Thiodiazotropha sp. (ex. Lucinisca nassula)]|nr:hypothetical protein [Candidatus Thiodiazotropha sp. (ex. Lucinisca nassula)]
MRIRNNLPTIIHHTVGVHLILLFCLIGCDTSTSTRPVASSDWSREEMVIHQLHELIRYEELEYQQRLDELDAFSLPRPAAAIPEY